MASGPSSDIVQPKNKRPKRSIVAIVLMLLLMFLGFMWRADLLTDIVKRGDDTRTPEQILNAAYQFYWSRPYYERPRPYSPVPEGLPDIKSSTCGACHQEIYKEWSVSTHKRAWLDDAQFMEELAKSRGDYAQEGEEKTDVSWMCVNCHTPMVNQLEKLVVGLENNDIGKPIYVDNPYFDPELQLDAIGCATCHVQDGIVYGPRGDTNAPHPTARNEHLSSEQICASCHQAEATFPEQNLACFFTTAAEWQNSSYPTQEQNCQSCHMPQVTRKLAEAFDVPERKTRHHWFGGSLIPKHPDYEEELAALKPIFGSGVEIELVNGADDKNLLRITNSFAGHLFPTGDPERYAIVKATITDAQEKKITTQELRIGKEMEWWPEIKVLSDNRIPPGDSMDFPIEIPHVDTIQFPITITIDAHKYRINQEAFDYHDLEGRYVAGRQFHHSKWLIDANNTIQLQKISDDKGERTTLHPVDDSAVDDNSFDND